MINTTTSDELDGYVVESDNIIGCVLFSRFILPNNKSAYILSPMAIATDHQKKGLGQALIKYGINELKAKNVEILITYGDPGYYSKVGFEPITEDMIQAPQPLTYPSGWLAQSLTSNSIKPMPGKTTCISALNAPVYW
ncbi:MAG: N-acetyltransferase [Marinicella sp.]